jgi:hypothetical protein
MLHKHTDVLKAQNDINFHLDFALSVPPMAAITAASHAEGFLTAGTSVKVQSEVSLSSCGPSTMGMDLP